MRKVKAFNFLTLNGYFEGAEKGDISWHRHGLEENDYAVEMLKSGDILLLGRITYEHMAGFWPTPFALQHDPVLASGMNNAEKIVFSRTLENPEWNNTRLIKNNIADEIKQLKKTPGHDMTLLGSGSIITQFSDLGLIDEYEIMIDPVAIGNGNTLFNGLHEQLNLELLFTRAFKSGVVLLRYGAVKKQ